MPADLLSILEEVPEQRLIVGYAELNAYLTDEFADSVVNYGVNSTVYTATSTDNLYVKEHRIALAGLSSGTTYYFVVKSTDRSGNSAVSMEEYTFTTEG
jgi:hypothetical protein